jgi:hypothetical protein
VDSRLIPIFSEKHNIIWKELENLKPDTLEKICRRVHGQLTDDSNKAVDDDDVKYVPVDEEDLQKERVVKNGAVQFQFGLQYTLKMPILKCQFEGRQFYLCHGNDTHVFRLSRDLFGGSYRFESGLHEVEWN